MHQTLRQQAGAQRAAAARTRTGPPGARAGERPPPAATTVTAASRHSDREDRQQPAPEVAPLQPHEGEEQQRRRHEHPAERRLPPPHEHHPRERRQRRHPPQPPGEAPQVVHDAPLAGSAQLALGFGRLAGLAHQFGVEGVRVEDRIWVREHEHGQRRQRPRQHAREHAAPRVPLGPSQARGCGRQQRHDHDPRRVLGRTRQPETGARQQVVADAAFAQHPRRPQQRGGQRRQRGDVVEGQVGVEARQEGDRLDRRRQQPGGRAPAAGRRGGTAATAASVPSTAAATRASS